MTYMNARAKNTGNDEGDVFDHFQDNMAHLVQKNGGDHHFNWKTFECTEQTAPHPINTKTYLRLTTNNFHITQFDKSFINVQLDVSLKLDKSIALISDDASITTIFVGLKNAAELFHKLDTVCNNRMLNNTQDDAMREQYAYNVIKGKAQKATAKHSHTLYANVASKDSSICGRYIALQDIHDGASHTFSFEFVIPYIDFLKYQAFGMYPNSIVGELTELLQTSTDAFVWCPVPINSCIEEYQFLHGADPKIASAHSYSGAPDQAITRKFIQVGNSGNICYPYVASLESTSVTWTTAPITVSITSATIQQMRTNIAGFNVKPEVLESIRSLLQTPMIIPSQTLDRRHFAQTPRSTGIDTTTDIALNNATNITVMFPRRTNDVTCFENIMYQNVQLSVNKHQYPDTEISTVGARFYQMQCVANELDGTLEPTQDFEESFTTSLNADNGTLYPHTRKDATNFGINFQLERSNGGYVFDGLDTGSRTIPINFKGQPIYSGTNDGYYNVGGDTDLHPPAPELWICQDTHFLMSVNGLEYMGPTTPEGYA